MTLDLSTERGILNFAARRREEMRRIFHDDGRFESRGNAYVALAISTHDIRRAPGKDIPFETGERLPAPKAVPVNLPALARLLPVREHTAAFAHIVREFCVIAKAIGVLVMSEMWFASLKSDTKEKAMAEREARPESLEDWDDRREALFMSLEHAALAAPRIWLAPIKRSPTILEPWKEQEDAEWEGRLVGLVRTAS